MLPDEPAPVFQDAGDFWDHLATVLSSADCDTHEQIDDALRSYLIVAAANQDLCLDCDSHVARCCLQLLHSKLFLANREYVRRQYIYCILEEEDLTVLYLSAAILLHDGRGDHETFQMMQQEAAFPRLLNLLRSRDYDDTPLHRTLLDLLCDMSRIQRLSLQDLDSVDDSFILYLFDLIEQLSHDAGDPYHYTIIRLLLVLNEQYMCASHIPDRDDSVLPHDPVTPNRIVAIISQRGPDFRTFGENLILLLNRESGLGPQLLILKMLYLLFTNPMTFEYFYTNDLHVLVDVIIRNLLDLDPGSSDDREDERRQIALRHTYLRVLYPLLRNTQLAKDGAQYKRDVLRKLFHLLVNADSVHFAPVDDTVVRLVARCKQVSWIADPADTPSDMTSPVSSTDTKHRMLGMHLAAEGVSSLSIASVSGQIEKKAPAVPPPRRQRKKTQPSDLYLQVPDSAPQSNAERGQSPFTDEFREMGDE